MKKLLIKTIAAVLLSLSVQAQESRTPQLQKPSPVKSQKAKTPNKTETRTRISRNPVELLTRWLTMDKNGDEKLGVDETTGQLKTSFNRNDTNKDGFLDRGELETLSKRLIRRRSRGQSPGPKPTHAGVAYGTGQELVDMYLPKATSQRRSISGDMPKGRLTRVFQLRHCRYAMRRAFHFLALKPMMLIIVDHRISVRRSPGSRCLISSRLMPRNTISIPGIFLSGGAHLEAWAPFQQPWNGGKRFGASIACKPFPEGENCTQPWCTKIRLPPI